MRTRFFSLLLFPSIFISCGQNEELITNKELISEPIDSSYNIREDIIGYEDTGYEFEREQIKIICENLADPRDTLLNLYEFSKGVTLDTIGENAWVMDFWYGGSGEDIFCYKQNQDGTYSKIFAANGAIGYELQEKSDKGLKRILVKNNRSDENVIFYYNGTDYSNFIDGNKKYNLRDSIGAAVLIDKEIYID